MNLTHSNMHTRLNTHAWTDIAVRRMQSEREGGEGRRRGKEEGEGREEASGRGGGRMERSERERGEREGKEMGDR